MTRQEQSGEIWHTKLIKRKLQLDKIGEWIRKGSYENRDEVA